MAERHDNSKPAHAGTISLSRLGVFNYFPIEEAGHLKPFMALFIHERTDGSLHCSIDQKLVAIHDFDE